MKKYLIKSKTGSGMTDSDILDIRRMCQPEQLEASGMTKDDVARAYNIHNRTLYKILSRQTWKHVPDPQAVKSMPNYTIYPDGRVWSNSASKFITPIIRKSGERVVSLKNKGTRSYVKVAELVARAYVSSKSKNVSNPQYLDDNPSNVHFTNIKV